MLLGERNYEGSKMTDSLINEVEKRELLEQQRMIFEAGAQRTDKRTGSFSFLTWPFLIAPLIASKEFLLATLNPAAAAEEDGKAALASVPAVEHRVIPAFSNLSWLQLIPRRRKMPWCRWLAMSMPRPSRWHEIRK
jgi:hypothetical protein